VSACLPACGFEQGLVDWRVDHSTGYPRGKSQARCRGTADRSVTAQRSFRAADNGVAMQSVLALSDCLALRHLNLGHNQLPSVAGLEGAGPALVFDMDCKPLQALLAHQHCICAQPCGSLSSW